MNNENNYALGSGNISGKSFKSLFRDQRFLLGIIIVLIIVIVSIVNSNFLNPSNILALLQQIAVLGLLTMAMAKLMLSGE